MPTMSSKRTKRIEKKKKKMAALLEITKLNEQDRTKHARASPELTSTEIEPSAKKPRTEELESQGDQVIETVSQIGPSGKTKISGEDFLQLKLMLRQKTNRMRADPRFRLREIGETAELSVNIDDRIPLFLSDVQHLLMFSQIGHHSPYSPARWCQLEKYNRLHETTVLVMENISMYHYQSNESFFPFLTSTFPHKLEIITPGAYKGDIVQDLGTVPLTGTQVRKYIDQFGTLEEAVSQSMEVFDRIKELFPVEDASVGANSKLPSGDKFPRTHLLLSGWQMVEENFPLPIKGLMETKYAGYVLTKETYKEVTPTSPLFGIDCEMCRTTIGDLELTRVSVVDEDFKVFYEELVKPDNKITDYLTKFSGITPKLMRGVTKTLKDVQQDLRKLLPADAILVGQSLGNDLHALKIMHPYIIDTSIIYNITGDRMRKTKLQTLAREFLSERIQESRSGHCSIEDSLASLKLAKHKLKHDLYYGDAVMANMSNQLKHHPELGHPHFATSMLRQVTKLDKKALIISVDDIIHKYQFFTYKEENVPVNTKVRFVTEKSNHDVVKKLRGTARSGALNIAHIRFTESQLDDEPELLFKQIDKWIQETYEVIASPGLCVVVFGGQSQGGNGCSFITIKKSP